MLEVNHLTKKFGKTLANDDLNFTIPTGCITVMLGPNGAGKSTAMKSIMGLLRHDGWVKMNGLNTNMPEAKRLVGYVPEMPALYPNLTVDEHLEFIARAYRLKDYTEYKEELLERMQLTDKKKKFGDELSKGMQQKLSLCIGLLPKPKLILFDEPMIGLDPHAIRELKEMFKELRSQGVSLLISTHIIDSVDELWDQTLIMKDGRVLAQVTKDSLKESGKTLEEVYFELTEEEAAELKQENAKVKPESAEEDPQDEEEIPLRTLEEAAAERKTEEAADAEEPEVEKSEETAEESVEDQADNADEPEEAEAESIAEELKEDKSENTAEEPETEVSDSPAENSDEAENVESEEDSETQEESEEVPAEAEPEEEPANDEPLDEEALAKETEANWEAAKKRILETEDEYDGDLEIIKKGLDSSKELIKTFKGFPVLNPSKGEEAENAEDQAEDAETGSNASEDKKEE